MWVGRDMGSLLSGGRKEEARTESRRRKEIRAERVTFTFVFSRDTENGEEGDSPRSVGRGRREGTSFTYLTVELDPVLEGLDTKPPPPAHLSPLPR